MGCKSAAKSKLEEETVASSSSSLFFSCEEAVQSPAERETIQEQGVGHSGKFSLGDGEDSDESNAAARISSGRSFPLRESSGTSVIADDSVDR